MSNREVVELIKVKGINGSARQIADSSSHAPSNFKSLVTVLSRINKKHKQLTKSKKNHVASTGIALEKFLQCSFVLPKPDVKKSVERYEL